MKRQKSPWSCGAAVVRNALRNYGIKVSEHSVRSYSKTTRQFGTSEKGILSALRAWEITATEHHFDDKNEAFEWLYETILNRGPVILAVENWEHWVIALGVSATGITVFDSSNFKVNMYENCTHVWDKKTLFKKWWNDRKSIDDETESRIYAISTKK